MRMTTGIERLKTICGALHPGGIVRMPHERLRGIIEQIERETVPAPEWPEYIEVSHEGIGDLMRYIPDCTARLEYDDVHGCNICTGCGERYEHGMYMAVNYDDFIAYRPMRYCPACGARLVD